MRSNRSTLLVSFLGLLTPAAAAFAVQACGSAAVDPSTDTGSDGGQNGDVTVTGSSDGGTIFQRLDGSTTTAPDSGPPPCVNLQCQQVTCSDAGTTADGDVVTTTLSGRVYDPAGINPLYNALVYIPNGPLADFDDDAGVTCDKCGALASGSPLVSAITAADGSFTLTNVPVGNNLPLVIQVGKWRRVIPAGSFSVDACKDNALPVATDPASILTRLPRNQSEGHIPLIAIATGNADPMECLLRKIGIDDAEFTTSSGTGRVHVYQTREVQPDGGAMNSGGSQITGATMDGGVPNATALWESIDTLRHYDMLLLPCESTPSGYKSGQALQNLQDYTAAGGRAFTTHYSSAWLEDSPAPFPSVAVWEHDENDRSDHTGRPLTIRGVVNDTFPKGQAFSDWLYNVDASATFGRGSLEIAEWRHDSKKANEPPSQSWISADTYDAAVTDAPNTVQHFTFNTPINAPLDDAGDPMQCGKVVFSDFHVSASETSGARVFPQECKGYPTPRAMSPQEKALEFMFFDLSACVQKDTDPPKPPPPQPPPVPALR